METITLKDKRFEPFISEAKILDRIIELGKQINKDYEGEELLLLPVLNGAFIFAADLIRELTPSVQVQFIRLSTYGDEMSSSRSVRSSYGLESLEVFGKNILIVEDIIDTGFTAGFIKDYLQKENPKSVKIAAMLFKPDAFEGKDNPEYIGFDIPNKFVVGYGLDYAQTGRELKSIYQLVE